jgi:hypothetical protein
VRNAGQQDGLTETDQETLSLMMPRLFAAMLAVGAVPLAGLTLILLIYAITDGNVGGALLCFTLVFGPGCLLTVGYVVRAVHTPAFPTRVKFWCFSFVVQGVWLVIGLRDHPFSSATLWWSFAFIASALSLLLEFFVDDEAVEWESSPSECQTSSE